MHQTNLTNSTNTPEACLNGVSQNNYITPWNLNQWFSNDITAPPSDTFLLEWARPDNGTYVAVAATFKKEPQQHDLLRVACHYIIELTPDEGLEDIGESIAEIYEFYSNRLNSIPSASMLKTTTEPASLGEQFTRERFYISTEE